MSNLGILFTSRNNYRLLESWMSKVDTEGCKILNIDNFSILVDINNKKSLIYKHSIAYIK